MEQLARQSIEDKKMVFISVDIEVYELNHNCVTEIGVAVLDLRKGNTKDVKPVGRHLRVKEYMHLKNGKFVEDASEKFEFGTSEILTLKQSAEEVKKIFEEYKDRAIFVGHDGANDVRYLRQLGVELPEELPMVDTLTLWKINHGEDEQSTLGRLLMEYDIRSWNLHNAGNDAYYTVQVLMAMCVSEAGKE
ncbi:ribonuclease H-like domain-containing protein [Lipomyces kononenkoae]|uniref:Ribonuclease H-like domain-containing protein n=1 Tax=Lipomyces kononenkoae TaxID=34357 RepID=A0ACC3SYB5_LIPKO